MLIGNPPIKQYAIHHTAVSRHIQSTQLDAVNRYHKEKDWGGGWTIPHPSCNGWYVAYNYFIDVDGTTTYTRKIGEETYANKGHNCDIFERCDTVSICLAGDFNRELPTDVQIESLRSLICELKDLYPHITFTFHRDIQNGRSCPGKLFTHTYMKQRVLGNTSSPDEDDRHKSERITEMYQQLDNIRAVLRRLRYLLLLR